MAFARPGDNRRAWELFTLINPVNHGRSAGEMRVTVDGIEQPDNSIPLIDDHREHRAEVKMPVAGS